MAPIRQFPPVLRVMAVSSRHAAAFPWAIERAEQQWGPIDFVSDVFDFSETGFYSKSMGAGLSKQLLAFHDLMPQEEIVDSKHDSNGWEEEFENSRSWEEERPINLDPGYITEAKLVLATTKDRDHRIYLDGGIFAEVTLYYQGLRWQSSRWTYPDYQRDDYHAFFERCRLRLRERYAAGDFAGAIK